MFIYAISILTRAYACFLAFTSTSPIIQAYDCVCSEAEKPSHYKGLNLHPID